MAHGRMVVESVHEESVAVVVNDSDLRYSQALPTIRRVAAPVVRATGVRVNYYPEVNGGLVLETARDFQGDRSEVPALVVVILSGGIGVPVSGDCPGP